MNYLYKFIGEILDDIIFGSVIFLLDIFVIMINGFWYIVDNRWFWVL